MRIKLETYGNIIEKQLKNSDKLLKSLNIHENPLKNHLNIHDVRHFLALFKSIPTLRHPQADIKDARCFSCGSGENLRLSMFFLFLFCFVYVFHVI